MASLNKLAIRGIRSFDDKHVQVIEFYAPLTVIVGHNGSGKTTIIECLKYATTGDLPPNTKGGAFVHDPKIANEKEVKAQVRLRFWNVNRQRMTATRNLQVQVKKTGGLTMKTLEGLLAKTEPDGGDGKRNTISTKCSEMDEEVPLLLGVSKSILENVIFCHQEDSNWPLSEPAALKKKFDDIFEATKYTKALDHIKVLRKERAQDLKVQKERLNGLKKDKEKSERLQKELDEMIAGENAKQTEVESLKEEYEGLKEQNADHFQRGTGYNTIFERYDNLRSKKEMLEGNVQRMKEGITMLKESTEDLSHQYLNFDDHLKTIEAKRDKQIDARDKEEAALEDLRRRLQGLYSTQGELKSNRKTYEGNVRERERKVRDVAKRNNFSGYDYSPLEESKIVEFVDRLYELVRKAESDLKRVQSEGARKERDLQAELDQLADAKTSALATKESKVDQISSLNGRIRTMEAQFDSVSSVDADISVLENDIGGTKDRREKLDEEIREARYDEQLRERGASIRQKDAERDKTNSELSALNRQADSRAQLSIKRSELQAKKAQIDASVKTHAARYKDLVGSDLQAEKMEEGVTVAAGRKDRELQDAESKAAAGNRSLSQLQTTLNIAKQNLKRKQDEAARLERAINDALHESGQSSVDKAIEEAEAELNLRKDEIADKDNSVKLYKKIGEVARTKKKCIGCDRAIHDNEKNSFEAYIKNRVERLSAGDLSEVKEELEQWQSELSKLREVQPSVMIVKSLREREIPELERQIADVSAEVSKVQQEAEDVSGSLSETILTTQSKEAVQQAKIASRDLQTLKSGAVILSRTIGEVKDLQSDIQRLERDLQSSGSLKTVEEVQAEADKLTAEIKNLQREQQTLSSDKELKVNTLRGLSDELNRKSLRLSELKTKQERRRMDEAALAQHHGQLVALQKDLKELDAVAAAAVAPWREKNEALDRYRSERHSAEYDASEQVGLYQSSVSEIEAKHQACQSYVAAGNDRKLRENDSHIDDIKGEITATQDAKSKMDKLLEGISGEISQAKGTRKNIKSNLDLREEELRIQGVEGEMEGLDIEGAAKARREFNTVYKVNLEKETEVQNQWQLSRGELVQMTVSRKRAQQTLKDDYKNVKQLFRDQLVLTKTGEVANHDLEKYGKALDNAILAYHAIKMAEINDTIGHLWSKTYQGTDIDNIRIVSDHDEASTAARKSYNYRVVMVKNDVELDMRGRCSAGQKVLASIIIRLALAESFGQGCGVLALDEPTTNLDQENINALAEALAEIINDRRQQANFQLIVITHDEGFLQRLAAHDVLEYYWRVSRDASQKSVLERQRVGI